MQVIIILKLVNKALTCTALFKPCSLKITKDIHKIINISFSLLKEFLIYTFEMLMYVLFLIV